MNPKECIEKYKTKYRDGNKCCRSPYNIWYPKNTGKVPAETDRSFDLIVDEAVFPCGKVHKHQRRIGQNKLVCFKQKILPLEQEIRKCEDFDSILGVISSIQIKGIAELTKYDVSLGISSSFGMYPDKVYLHAGTKEGARNLGLIKKGHPKKHLALGDIEEGLFDDLKPYEIEDFLCIYKDKFPDLVRNS